MHNPVQSMINNYTAWLKNNIFLRQVDDVTEITTPFLDRHNDHIQLYLEKKDGQYLLTDDGYTINDLEISGLSFESPKRNSILMSTLNGFGVNLNDKEIFVEVNENTFPQKKHMLVQAILAVNDMFYLSQPHTKSFFLEDISNWLDRNEIRFMSNIQIQGKTGYINTFEFAIPRSHQKQERLIKTINTPSKSNIQATLMAFVDSKQNRPDFIPCAFLNDSNVSENFDLTPFYNYEVKTILWSQRDNFLDFLAA